MAKRKATAPKRWRTPYVGAMPPPAAQKWSGRAAKKFSQNPIRHESRKRSEEGAPRHGASATSAGAVDYVGASTGARAPSRLMQNWALHHGNDDDVKYSNDARVNNGEAFRVDNIPAGRRAGVKKLTMAAKRGAPRFWMQYSRQLDDRAQRYLDTPGINAARAREKRIQPQRPHPGGPPHGPPQDNCIIS